MRSPSRTCAGILRVGLIARAGLIVAAMFAFAGCPQSGAPAPAEGGASSADGGSAGDPGTVVAGETVVAGDGAPDGAGDAGSAPDGGAGGGNGDAGGAGDGSGGAENDSTGGTPSDDISGTHDDGSGDTTAPPRLILSDSLLNFGSDSTSLTVRLSNGGSGSVSYLVSSTDPWISFAPAAGVVGATPVDVTVSVNRANLWLGTFWSTVSVTGSDNSNHGIIAITTKSGVPAPRDQILAWMRQLGPLNRRHFTWKPYYDFYLGDDELLYEFIRINNGVTWADWPNASIIDKLVRMCKQINQANPAIPASIAFFDSPYYRYWPIDAPPTYNGVERAQELAAHGQQLATLSNYLGTSNARYNGPNIEISAIIYDTELWRLRTPADPDYVIWNTAMRNNYDDIYNITRIYFPTAPVEWYSRGWIRFFGNVEPPGWATEPYYHFDLTEQGDACSAVMYRLPMQNASREVFTRTAQYAAAHGVSHTTPWLALGAGYRPIPNSTNAEYTPDWNFDMQVSWNFGHEINDLSNPVWSATDYVVFYPIPFDTATPYYAQHYIAYVRGAQNIAGLPQ